MLAELSYVEKPGAKRVLIVDDHPLFREGLRSLVDRSSGFVTAGEAGTGGEAVRMAQELNPDLLTLDVSLPDMSGMEAAKQILQAAPGIRILMVSMHSRMDCVADAFLAGARGYVVKEATGLRLIQALKALSQGEYFLDGNVSQETIAQLVKGDDPPHQDALYGTLTPREQQVMRFAAEGMPTREISRRLAISAKTVENHRANLMKKLDVHNRMELVRYAARIGLIDVSVWKE